MLGKLVAIGSGAFGDKHFSGSHFLEFSKCFLVNQSGVMTTELLEIQPDELKFTFELKKQSSCLIQLRNSSEHYVAFKVKTTSPKNYCVRPNTGIVKPKQTCDFTVTMQAQRSAPSDVQCKDKFLIQSTIVPFGTSEEDIVSSMFAKDSGKNVEERKLKVILISPPPSPVLLPFNGELKEDPRHEISVQNNLRVDGVKNIPPLNKMTENSEEFETSRDEELRPPKNDVQIPNAAFGIRPSMAVEEAKLARDDVVQSLKKELEELKSKLNIVNAKLQEAEVSVMNLTDQNILTNREKEMLRLELGSFKRINGVKSVQIGFPLLYVILVALISLIVGYSVHP